MNDLIEAARAFAENRHSGQTDKLGHPYIAHLDDVASRVRTLGSVVVCIGWLHDCVEDTSATLDEIEELFGGEIRDGVDAMTKRDGEDYFSEYLVRLKSNTNAILVKIADASHNLGKAHLLADAEPEKARCLEKKYRKVLAELGVRVSTPERLRFKDGGWRSAATAPKE